MNKAFNEINEVYLFQALRLLECRKEGGFDIYIYICFN